MKIVTGLFNDRKLVPEFPLALPATVTPFGSQVAHGGIFNA